ncbi:TraB/GumN family protein [Novosphingopyxis sp. YJ-S2-01]|uniref:TraB/GumN family protein n=1 Tax=Novosphingopyxis sp. YJ-S2-01 TaxID=2794021 RepID=UPI0018DEAC8E|nr:TraB/GumN family protein [Novosphingopyxis sp. YJ-S2-01]MBH9537805.1 TraB/GumN family protein [Novosphingopyxis sp. YJ-S2-01]
MTFATLRKSALAGALGLGLIGFGAANAQEAVQPGAAAAQGEAAPASAPATVQADPALWLVEDDDTKIYLFGTVHMLKPGIDWFAGPVKAAWDASDSAVFEVLPGDDQAATVATFQRLGTDQTGVKLRDRLEGEDRSQYEAALTSFGIPYPTFDSFEPWLATMNLSLLGFAKAGFDPNSGVESILQAKAKAAAKPMIGLETIEEQLGFLDSLPMTSQVKWLNETVDTLPDADEAMDEMVSDWAAGEPEKLAELLNEGMNDPVLRKAMLTQRNENWAKWIDHRLEQPGTVFLAVGSGHLAGADSVQDQLKRYGLNAVRVE